ncbi:MAG: hsp70 family protein [Gammaproteobacteria bacterium]|nr:hsp70 family protein [Gammaproteobacteria bacterium]
MVKPEQQPASAISAQYLVGIDLGTTHTVVAFADRRQGLDASAIQLFEVEQLVAPGEVARRPLLPCFRYHPLAGELAASDCQLPWDRQAAQLPGEVEGVIIGEWARELGAKVDGRQVVSAKSWLSNAQVDRRAPILPWAAAEGVTKVSPLLASASYLAYIRAAWNHAHPEAPLQQQEIVITVPASFDEVARVLTVEAARLAGLPHISLLEEPQAVCYDWFAGQGHSAAAQLGDSKLLLVCDVGGGTTDLSLIQVAASPDQPLQLTRVGVGDHLMLGGDNIDLALAHIVEERLQLGKKLSAAQLSQLIQQTRSAKERLLAAEPLETATVTLLGSGSRLIGGAKKCQLTRADIEHIALDGFLPLTGPQQLPARKRSAVVEFGLPYASEPAISKHLAAFVQAHRTACCQALGLDPESSTLAMPDGLLLNGGVFNSPQLQQRVQDLLRGWRQDDRLTCLDNTRPDLAVACGAVVYSMARHGAQPKIGGGSARSYFLALEQPEDEPARAICLLPRRSEESQEVLLEGRQFLLTLDQPVRFLVYATHQDHTYKAGELVTVDDSFSLLPPLVAALAAGDSSANNSAKVNLLAQLTEVGTLQLDCLALEPPFAGRRWHVEFQVRQNQDGELPATDTGALPSNWPAAKEKIDLFFGTSKRKVDPKLVKSLRADLEKMLGKRDSWDINLLRAMFDQLLAGAPQRKRSQVHERVWLNLAGFALRPGFGDPADGWRMEQVWGLYQDGLHYPRETQSWIDWWTFWRRVAGGLGAEQQQRIFADLEKFIDPASNNSRKLQAQAKLQSYEDMVRLSGALEQLSVATKNRIGDWLLRRLEKASETETSWWALGRIGSRQPFHGSVHKVVPAAVVEEWLEILLAHNWRRSNSIPFAAVMLGRVCGDRSRDIDAAMQAKVVAHLRDIKAPESWVAMTTEVQELSEKEAKRVFGESLPSGLRLLDV